MVHSIKHVLDAFQPFDQFGFRPRMGVEHALIIFETMTKKKTLEWGLDLWMASLDLRRAFDKIEHESFFGALRAQGLPNVYIDLLRVLYRNQSGVVEGVEGSDPLNIQRGIKQGDVLSPALSCTIQFWFGTSCVLLENESHNFTTNGVDVGGNERLTNARYADDLLLYATTLPELVYMIQILCEKTGTSGFAPERVQNEIFDNLCRLCSWVCQHQWWNIGCIGLRCCAQIFGSQVHRWLVETWAHWFPTPPIQTNTSPSSCACGCLIQSSPLRFSSASSLCHWHNPSWPVWTLYKKNVAINGGLGSHSRWGLVWHYGANARQSKQRIGLLPRGKLDKTIGCPTTQLCCKICKATWVASNDFGVVSAEQLAKQLWQITETKTWQTSQEMAGKIEQILWKGLRSIRTVDGGSKKPWVVSPPRSAVILSLLCQQLKHCWYSAPCPHRTVVSNSNGRKAKKVRYPQLKLFLGWLAPFKIWLPSASRTHQFVVFFQKPGFFFSYGKKTQFFSENMVFSLLRKKTYFFSHLASWHLMIRSLRRFKLLYWYQPWIYPSQYPSCWLCFHPAGFGWQFSQERARCSWKMSDNIKCDHSQSGVVGRFFPKNHP